MCPTAPIHTFYIWRGIRRMVVAINGEPPRDEFYRSSDLIITLEASGHEPVDVPYARLVGSSREVNGPPIAFINPIPPGAPPGPMGAPGLPGAEGLQGQIGPMGSFGPVSPETREPISCTFGAFMSASGSARFTFYGESPMPPHVFKRALAENPFSHPVKEFDPNLPEFYYPVRCAICNSIHDAVSVERPSPNQGRNCAAKVILKNGIWNVVGFYGSDYDTERFVFVDEEPRNPKWKYADPVCDRCVKGLIDAEVIVQIPGSYPWGIE